MSPISVILLLIFLLLLTTTSTSISTESLIQSTCRATTDHSLCIATLKSDPNSPKATSIADLSRISVAISLSCATNTSQYMLDLAHKYSSLDASMPGSSALRSCAQRYGNARESLQWALVALEEENYDYAAVHVGAAGEYPGMCRALFRGRPESSYPAEVARREDELKGLCRLDLDLVSLVLDNLIN